MARTKIDGSQQILNASVGDGQLSGSISTAKLLDGADFFKRDGSVAATADLALGGFKVTGAAAGTNATDLVTKLQLDQSITGLDAKESVRLGSDANIDLTTGTLLIVDSVQTVAGDRILVMGQTDDTENGIYVAGVGAWARSTDADEDAEVTANLYAWIEEGTVYGDQGFILSVSDPLSIGTSSLTFTQFNGLGQIVAGDAITKTGNRLDVTVGDGLAIVGDAAVLKLDGSTLTVGANGVKLSALTAGSLLVGDGSNVAAPVTVSGDMTLGQDGTATVQAGAITNAKVASNAAIATTKLADGAEFLKRDGSVALTSALDGGSQKLSSVAAGTAATDVSVMSQLNANTFIFHENEVPSGTMNDANTTFTLSASPIAGSQKLYHNGLRLAVGAGADYTIADDVVTLTYAPSAGDALLVDFREANTLI